MTRTPPYKSRNQLLKCAPFSASARLCQPAFTAPQAPAISGAEAPDPAAPSARRRHDTPCACGILLPVPPLPLRSGGNAGGRIAALWRAGRCTTMGQEAKKGTVNSREIIDSGGIAYRRISETTRKPIACSAVKTRYDLYRPMVPIPLTAPSLGRAFAQCEAYALHTLRQQTDGENAPPTANHFALSSAFRCSAPEPRLAFGSAGGASTLAWFGKAPPAPHGKCCACGKEATLGAAPCPRVQHAPRVDGGAGRTSPQALWLSRRYRAAGAARSGASAPESLRLGGRIKMPKNAETIPSGRSPQPYKPPPLPASLPPIYASTSPATPCRHISGGRHA